MDTLIVIGALALFLAMLLSAGTPAPQPPTVVIMQSPPSTSQSGGCLGLIFAIVLFAALVTLVAQVPA